MEPMLYSKFTLSRAIDDFALMLVEGQRFLPNLAPIVPSPLLQDIAVVSTVRTRTFWRVRVAHPPKRPNQNGYGYTLKETLPWAIAVSTEKSRSEGLINPVLLEVKRQLHGQISVFSGEEFNVDPEADLNGYCDFLMSRSPEQLFIKALAVVIVEAKKEDLKPALGQCVAEMVAVQRFNQMKQQPIPVIYGVISSGTVWRFLKLEDQTVTIDLTDYPLPPVEPILGFLVWMVKEG